MASEALKKTFFAIGKTLEPPKELTYSAWAEENFRLSSDSPRPGRFKPWKFQRGWMDAIGDPLIPRVSIIKSARIGFTVSLSATLGAVAVNDPCPIILLTPRDVDAKGIMVDDVDPHWRATPSLRGLMNVGRYDGRNTLTYRTLPGGGSIKSLSAESPTNLRRHRAKVLLCDEVDGMKVTKEGDPLQVAEYRTQDYSDRKIVKGSTPLDDVTSIIIRQYDLSDRRLFEIPCIACGTPFELLWDHINWTQGKPQTAVAVCPHCGGVIEEKHKAEIVEAGEWRITNPEVTDHAGFRINALVSSSPNALWGMLAAEYEKALKLGPTAMQPFYNLVLGKVWTNSIDYVSENQLLARREPFGLEWSHDKNQWRQEIPEAIGYITAGVDVQPDRFEITYIGWSQSQRYVLGHEVIRGSVRLTTIQDELDSRLATFWRHPHGGEIGIEAACIDSGDGNMTQMVYDFCEIRQARKIVAIKGRDGNLPILKAQGMKRNRTSTQYIVGVDGVKTDILTSLALDIGADNAIRFSNTLGEEYFRQLTAERRETVLVSGRPVVKFVRIERRKAEALDALTYGLAAKQLCRFDFDARYAQLRNKPLPKASTKDLVSRLHSL